MADTNADQDHSEDVIGSGDGDEFADESISKDCEATETVTDEFHDEFDGDTDEGEADPVEYAVEAEDVEEGTEEQDAILVDDEQGEKEHLEEVGSEVVANDAIGEDKGETSVQFETEPIEIDKEEEPTETALEEDSMETDKDESTKIDKDETTKENQGSEAEKTEEKPMQKKEKVAEKKPKKIDEDKLAKKEKVDLNVMPQVNVANLGARKYQVKLFPLRPSDFVNGDFSGTFRLANESLLYLYSMRRNSNGKAELYMSNFNKVLGVMQRLLKIEYHCSETNVKIIRKNDENVVVERALIRFDTRMMRIIWSMSHLGRKGTGTGQKRERIIGSVFVKNLPEGTSKDMLRLMFPFADEINYNPEKFKDGSARIVLSNRSAVEPCLKAFTKVEINGRVVEMRPLEKRKKEEQEKVEKKVVDENKEKTKSPAKASPQVDSNSPKKSPAKPAASASSVAKKDETPKRGAKVQSHVRTLADRQRQRARDILNSKNDKRGNRRGGFGRVSNVGSGRFSGPARKPALQNRFNEGFMQGPAAAAAGNQTKNMIHLQAQLSAAIQNQITMLNQTQLAVEKVKRDAVLSAVTNRAADFVAPGPSIGEIDQRRQQPARKKNNRETQYARRMKMDAGSKKRSAADAGFFDFQDETAFYPEEKRNVGMSALQRSLAESQREKQMQQEQRLMAQRQEMQERVERQRQQLQLQQQQQQNAMTQGAQRATGKFGSYRNLKANINASPSYQQRQQQPRQQQRRQDRRQNQQKRAKQQSRFDQLEFQNYQDDYGDDDYGYDNNESFSSSYGGRNERSPALKNRGFGSATSGSAYGSQASVGRNFGSGASAGGFGGRSQSVNFGTGASETFGSGGYSGNTLADYVRMNSGGQSSFGSGSNYNW